MAYEFYTDLDLKSVGQLLNTRVQNIADQTEQDALAATLGVGNEGLIIYRTDLKQTATWDGTQFIFAAIDIAGDVIFKGVVDASVTLDGQVEAVAGYQYVVGTAGTATATGVTFQPNATAEVGDIILFVSDTEAYIVQRNDVEATETTLGNILLATQAEVDAGTQATKAVTPLTLQTKLDGQFYTRQHTETVNLVAATPLTITHNLGLVNKDAFTINTMGPNGSQISVDVDSSDANSLTLTSLLPLNGVVVTVVGAKAVA